MTSNPRTVGFGDALSGVVADCLRNDAGAIVERWIEWVRSRSENPAVEALPRDALRNHIPPVLESLSRYVMDPSVAVQDDMLGHLRVHGQIRRDQGYDLEDLLFELDRLTAIVMEAVRRVLCERCPEAAAKDALPVFERLAAGLQAMASVTVSAYRSTEQDQDAALARRMGDLTRSIVHELRSPLQSVAIGAEVLDRAGDDPDTRANHIEMIRAAVSRAQDVLANMDLLAVTEQARAADRIATLPGLLETIREELNERAKHHDVQLEIEGAPPRVAVERLVAQLALINVVGNAIKYSDAGKAERWVKVTATLEEGDDMPFVRFVVSDNGLGIGDDYRGRVFQRGFRAHPEVSNGTGLGLAITRDLVQERGGSIELTSTEHEGTRVEFTLRAIDAEALDAHARHSHPDSLMHSSYEGIVATRQRSAQDSD